MDEQGSGQRDNHESGHGVDTRCQQSGQLVPLFNLTHCTAIGDAGHQEEQEQQGQNALEQGGVGHDGAVIRPEEGVLGKGDGHQNHQVDQRGDAGIAQALALDGGQLAVFIRLRSFASPR